MASIILIDDDEALRTTVECLLKAEGHEVTATGDGLEAMKILQSLAEFDLMICDLRMAPVDGMEVIETARREQPNMPILVLSAYINDEIFNKTMEMGVKGFVDKPFSLEDLLVPVRELLLQHGK